MHRPKSALPPASPSRKGGALHLRSPSRRAPPRSPSAPSCRLNCYSDFFPVGGSRSAVRGPSAVPDLCAGSLTKLEAKNHSGTQARFARTARVVVGALKTDGGTESSFTLLRRPLARTLPPLPWLRARGLRPTSEAAGRTPSACSPSSVRPTDRGCRVHKVAITLPLPPDGGRWNQSECGAAPAAASGRPLGIEMHLKQLISDAKIDCEKRHVV